MIVCHCNVIHCGTIRALASDHTERLGTKPSPGQVFRALGQQPKCARCVPLMTSVVSEAARSKAVYCDGCGCAEELLMEAAE